MFGILKKFFGSKEDREETVCQAEWLRKELREAEKERHAWQSQANVDATENLFLKKKLQEIRKLLGADDECFSKYTRDQIEEMELDEFVKIEHLIDKDVADGKLFLQ
jgi:hypothetical protein